MQVFAGRNHYLLLAGLAACTIQLAHNAARGHGPGDSPGALAQRGDAAVAAGSDSAASGHQRMLSALQDLRDRLPQDNQYLGEREAPRLRQLVEQLGDDESPITRFQLHVRLGRHELRLGREVDAIRQFEAAYHLLQQARRVTRAESGAGRMISQQAIEVAFYLGVAQLRLGETQNCCQRNTPDSCILPIRGEGIHSLQEGSRQAIRYFTEVIEKSASASGESSTFAQQARWLLNVAYMTIGQYPDQVPNEYLIAADSFQSNADVPRFVNIAARVGLASLSLSGGAVADDFDNDGYIDLVVSSWDPRAPIRVFRNLASGMFQDRASEAGLDGFCGGLNLLQADYDNDGFTDILALRGGWLAEKGQHPNSLFRNNGDGTFTDVTYGAGLADANHPTQTAAWADYDNDGDLDLYVGNESTDRHRAPCQLFRNDGKGTFQDVANEAGVTNDRFTKAVVWGDFDGDRLPDIYVSNLQGPNRLYHNNGDGTFTDRASELSLTEPHASFPAWFWDYDNDGHLDIYTSAYGAHTGTLAKWYTDSNVGHRDRCRLYRNNGQAGFTEVSRQCGLTRPDATMGSNFGDLNNDGFLDFYLGTGSPMYEDLMPSVMYLNQRGRTFKDISTAGGFGHLQKGHAVVFADFDGDGDSDVFEQMGGAFLGDAAFDAFYENPGFGNHWISVQLVGVASNRSAIGARIRVEIREFGKSRAIYRHVNSGGSFGANPLRQSIGLGQADVIERLDVYWPCSNLRQSFHDVPLDCVIRIVEGEDRWQQLDRPAFQLGGLRDN